MASPLKVPMRSLVLAAGLALVAAPSTAAAQEYTPWVFRAEIGAGTMLRDFNHDGVDTSTLAGELSGRVAYRLFEPLSIQIGAGIGRFWPSGSPSVPLIFGAAGLRLEPRLGRAARLWVEGNGGVYAIGPQDCAGFDGGLGIEFYLSDTIAIGPFGRFTHALDGRVIPRFNGVLAGSGPIGYNYADVEWWVAGLSLSIHTLVEVPPPPPPPPPPADTDHDGVTDPDDQCASVPAGEHPDALRRGCPLADDDHDGVYGPDDQCPTEAAGEHPDPARAGCPLADDDHDGVYGADDQCPTEAAGEHPNPERAGCPDGDGDHDGVLDHADQCPAEAAGIHPDPARAGCPAPDRDHDNVPDAVDHCPDRPGAPSSNPARNGCPGLLLLENGALRILRPVFFAPNRDAILPASNALMNAVADALRATPEVRSVSIEGHTDDVGDDATNLELSRRRAASVVRWLTTRGHIEAERLVSEGFGETRPLQQGTTSAARAQNRRVEFRIVAVAH